MKEIRLGIAGLGNVAQGVLKILKTNCGLIEQRTGIKLSVSRVASRSVKADVDLIGARFDTNLDSLLADDVDIVVELIGGEHPAREFILAALERGKPVVTANKAVIANHGNELMASNIEASLRYEAAVAGAIPIIQAVESGLVANRFEYLVGIINGTCNYILTAMQDQGADFESALTRAQELGYAEADPTFDVEGIDAAHKLTILLALAFDAPFNFADVYVEGISKVTAADIAYADELGYRIKHLAIARQVPNVDGSAHNVVEARVHPTLVAKQQLIANVNDVMNAVMVKSDAADKTLFSGPGAGGMATASAVLADIVATANTVVPRGGARMVPGVDILPIDACRAAQYLRIPTRDEPGAFAQIANALSQHRISIEAAIQKEPDSHQDIVDIVIVTQVTQEAEIAAALKEVDAMPHVTGEIARIRLDALD